MFIRLCVRLSFCFIWLLTFAFSVCWPQEISSLNGRILRKDNRLPLAGANVYLNNTTLGTCSHADGSFQIKSVPSGFYHLVVSLIGYRTVIQPLTIEPNHSDTLNIVLEPKELVLEDITVTGSIDKKWKKLLKILESVLLGSQAKEKQTRLLNPYCINIRQNQETDIIEADADSLLHIENLSLGYLLFVNLRYFSWKPGNGGGYRIQVRFYPLEPQDDSEIKTWEENRRRAYFGSFRHFLRCFFDCNWMRENFIVFEGVATDYFKAWNRNRLVRPNSTEIFLNAEIADSSYKTFISPGYYSVFYLGPSSRPVDDIGFLKNRKPLYSSGFQLDQSYVVIDRNGRLDNPMAISLFGHWADQRLADSLPLDYTPD